jgi:hypothetical protein
MSILLDRIGDESVGSGDCFRVRQSSATCRGNDEAVAIEVIKAAPGRFQRGCSPCAAFRRHGRSGNARNHSHREVHSHVSVNRALAVCDVVF